MIKQRALFTALLLIIPGIVVQAATTMLWFGNSYTEAGRQWAMLPKMINCTANCGTAEPSSMAIAITTELVPSCWLDCHETNGAFNKIDQGHYNLVFAQGSLANWLWRDYAIGTNLLNISTQMANWANHARSAGGKLVIEQMWMALGVPDHCDETQTRSDWWYDSIAAATNSILVPSGHAWYAAYEEQPKLEYTDPGWNDGCHPGKFGAYLNVCCQYAAITGKSPVGSTWHKVWMGDTLTLTDSEALFAQQKAWEAYQYFQSPTAIRDRRTLTAVTGIGTIPILQASYSEISRMVTVTGPGSIREIRVAALDGTLIPLESVGATCVVLNKALVPGIYFVHIQTEKARQTTSLKVGR